MRLVVDTTTFPPAVLLEDPEDFTSLKAVVRTSDHTWVTPTTIAELAGEGAQSPAWQENLAAMVAFADRHDWLDDDGRIRAHVEVEPARDA